MRTQLQNLAKKLDNKNERCYFLYSIIIIRIKKVAEMALHIQFQ